MTYYGLDDLRDWLTAQGFKIHADHMGRPGNECNWYAYRRSQLPARRCECNDDKQGMQILVKPTKAKFGDTDYESAEVEVCGEADGVWWKLSAYSLKPDDVMMQLDSVEASLIRAWNALKAEA